MKWAIGFGVFIAIQALILLVLPDPKEYIARLIFSALLSGVWGYIWAMLYL